MFAVMLFFDLLLVHFFSGLVLSFTDFFLYCSTNKFPDFLDVNFGSRNQSHSLFSRVLLQNTTVCSFFHPQSQTGPLTGLGRIMFDVLGGVQKIKHEHHSFTDKRDSN